MVIPFRRTIWSRTSPSSAVDSDRGFITLWSGPNAGIGAFQLIMWAMDDEYNGTVRRYAAAQVSEDGKTWVDVALTPVAPPTSGPGVNFGGEARHTLDDGWAMPYLRIGLQVQRDASPAGSALQTIEGRLTLISETL